MSWPALGRGFGVLLAGLAVALVFEGDLSTAAAVGVFLLLLVVHSADEGSRMNRDPQLVRLAQGDDS